MVCKAESDIRGTNGSVHPHILIMAGRQSHSVELESVLAKHSYKVTCLQPLEVASGKIDFSRFDCVFVDHFCGDAGVVDVISEIRRTQPLARLPVIFIQAADDPVSCGEMLRAGANIEISVPWNELLLLSKLDVQLRVRSGYLRVERQLLEYQRLNAHLVADLDLGQQVQQSFLPPSQLRTENFALEARLFAGGDLSGDYFDYALLSQDRLVVFLADVSGHGIASALLANRLKAFFDENTRIAHRPRLFMERLNKVILDLGEHNHIATAVCVHIDVADTMLTYASAGHRTMYWMDSASNHVELPTSGPALGMFKEFEINEINRSFLPGQNRLVTYTDGLVEFKMPDNVWVTEESFRDEVMLPNARLKLDSYVTALLDSSRRMTGQQGWEDDVSLLAVDF